MLEEKWLKSWERFYIIAVILLVAYSIITQDDSTDYDSIYYERTCEYNDLRGNVCQ